MFRCWAFGGLGSFFLGGPLDAFSGFWCVKDPTTQVFWGSARLAHFQAFCAVWVGTCLFFGGLGEDELRRGQERRLYPPNYMEGFWTLKFIGFEGSVWAVHLACGTFTKRLWWVKRNLLGCWALGLNRSCLCEVVREWCPGEVQLHQSINCVTYCLLGSTIAIYSLIYSLNMHYGLK